jgi:HTH domain.
LDDCSHVTASDRDGGVLLANGADFHLRLVCWDGFSMTETRSPSTALVEVVLANSSDPLTSREIADRTRVAHTTVWRGVETLRENGAVVPVDTGERVIFSSVDPPSQCGA